MAVSAPAIAPNNPAARAAKKRGRAVGSVSWNEFEGLVAFKALCHADEKHSASSKDERCKNAKEVRRRRTRDVQHAREETLGGEVGRALRCSST